MVQAIFRFFSFLIVVILLIYNVRRLIFTFAFLWTKNTDEGKGQGAQNPDYAPTVLILLPCRNEEKLIKGLCRAISQLDYPTEKCQVILIDDGSTDGTGEVMEYEARGREAWEVLRLPENVGKASALNAALSLYPFGEIVYIFDADYRPEAGALRRAVHHFKDPMVAGVCGRAIPMNPYSSPIAYYSTVESQINQMIMQAKDILKLAPALLGSNCGYRRSILEKCGGFREGELLEDFDLTLRFYRSGYRVRFVPEAVAKHQVPESTRGYLDQHIRWARGFIDVANRHKMGLIQEKSLSLPIRIDLLLFSAGYLDRLSLTSATILTIFSFFQGDVFKFPWQILALGWAAPLFQISILFVQQKFSLAMWLRIPLIPLIYVLDILASAKGIIDYFTRRSPTWKQTERPVILD